MPGVECTEPPTSESPPHVGFVGRAESRFCHRYLYPRPGTCPSYLGGTERPAIFTAFAQHSVSDSAQTVSDHPCRPPAPQVLRLPASCLGESETMRRRHVGRVVAKTTKDKKKKKKERTKTTPLLKHTLVDLSLALSVSLCCGLARQACCLPSITIIVTFVYHATHSTFPFLH